MIKLGISTTYVFIIVSHLAGLASTSAHIILHQHTYIGKDWGTGVPHLANSTK